MLVHHHDHHHHHHLVSVCVLVIVLVSQVYLQKGVIVPKAVALLEQRQKE